MNVRTVLLVAISLFSCLAIAGIQTIAEDIKDRGSFTEYVTSVVRSREMVQFLVLWAIGNLGVCANWFWKWLTDQITGSLWQYLFHDHVKRTIASFCCIFAWALWAVNVELTWTAVINLAITTGFAIDVLVNKATPKAA